MWFVCSGKGAYQLDKGIGTRNFQLHDMFHHYDTDLGSREHNATHSGLQCTPSYRYIWNNENNFDITSTNFTNCRLIIIIIFSIWTRLRLCICISWVPNQHHQSTSLIHIPHGTWYCIRRVEAFRPDARGFESSSSRHIGTLGKSLTRSCLWRFGMKLRHSIWVVADSSQLRALHCVRRVVQRLQGKILVRLPLETPERGA